MVTISDEGATIARAETLEKATELYKAALNARKTTGEKMAEAFVCEHFAGLAFVPVDRSWGTYAVYGTGREALTTLRRYTAQLIDHAIRQERESCLTCVREATIPDNGANASPYANGHRHAAEEIGQAIRARK